MAENSSRPISSDGRPIRVGSHIKVSRGSYHHHGIYVGRRQVIHYSGKSSGLFDKGGSIVRTSLETFLRGQSETEIRVVAPPTILSRDEIVAKAKARLNEDGYNVFRNNCEHFATECVTGEPESLQIQAAVMGGLFGLLLHNLSS